jgi:putative transposase
MISFIDEHRGVFGVEPICRLLPIAPSTYYENVAKRLDVDRLSVRARIDIGLKIEIRRVFEQNLRDYGVRKVWRQLKREGFDVARCTVARLMRSMSLQGIIRGKPVRTTFSDKAAPSPLDRVNRQFKAPAPNRLWVSDFTYVATWQGFVYVAFVIDVFSRHIVGWQASRTAHASFVLDALEQALHDRRPAHGGGLVHHSDRGVQYVSIRYSERLAEAGIEPSVGSVGDSYDNALAETINGLYKAEVIHRRGPWRNFEAVEFATLEWIDFRNGAVVSSTLISYGCNTMRLTARGPVNPLLRRAWVSGFQVIFPGRDGASVRGRRYSRHTMPGPRAVPARLSGSRARSYARLQSTHRRHRVPRPGEGPRRPCATRAAC